MRRPLVLAALVLCIIGCATASPVGRTGSAAAVAPSLAGAQPTPAQIVRRGRVGVTVEQVDDARRHLEAAATTLGADIARLDAREHESADYLFRVPPERLEVLMDSAASLGRVGQRTISAEDVTARVADAEGRLAALRASRDRLQQLMNQATSVSDVIAVERELARVQEELESLEGRLNAMRGQAARSELAVHLAQRHELGPVSAFFAAVGHALGKLFVKS